MRTNPNPAVVATPEPTRKILLFLRDRVVENPSQDQVNRNPHARISVAGAEAVEPTFELLAPLRTIHEQIEGLLARYNELQIANWQIEETKARHAFRLNPSPEAVDDLFALMRAKDPAVKVIANKLREDIRLGVHNLFSRARLDLLFWLARALDAVTRELDACEPKEADSCVQVARMLPHRAVMFPTIDVDRLANRALRIHEAMRQVYNEDLWGKLPPNIPALLAVAGISLDGTLTGSAKSETVDDSPAVATSAPQLGKSTGAELPAKVNGVEHPAKPGTTHNV